jgi:hypothetical protein
VALEAIKGWCGESSPLNCDGVSDCECAEGQWGEFSSEDDPVIVYEPRFYIYYPVFTIKYSSCSCEFEVKRFANHYAYYSHPEDVEFETLYFSAANVAENEGIIEFTIPCPWYPDIVNDEIQAMLDSDDYFWGCEPPCNRCEADFASGSIAVKFTVNILSVDVDCDEFVEAPE